jgi:hypothetical protein
MVKTPVPVLVSFLIFFGCTAQQKGTIPSKATIDILIDELASELTDSLAPEKRPKRPVAALLGPSSDHTQLGSFISEKLITRLFLSGRFERGLERKLLSDLLAQQRIEMEGYFDEWSSRSYTLITPVLNSWPLSWLHYCQGGSVWWPIGLQTASSLKTGRRLLKD